jgi:hypothetical protein
MTATERTPGGAGNLVSEDQRAARMRRARRGALVVGLLVLLGAGAYAALVVPFSPNNQSSTDNKAPTGLYTVSRERVVLQTTASGSIGYSGSYTVVDPGSDASSSSGGGPGAGAAEVYTKLPAAGQVIKEGEVLYEVNGNPVVLLYGRTPAYRSLSDGMTGADVAQLNHDLVVLGEVTSAEISADSDYFSAETVYGLEKLQTALGLPATGALPLGEAVFSPSAVRVTAVSATLGGPAQAGTPVLSATSSARQVSIYLDASQQSEVAVGDKTTISLPNGRTTTGVVASIGKVASSGSGGGNSGSASSPMVTVLVRPTDPKVTGTWDQASVNVTITTGSLKDALVVPVDSLLALASGGYGVEVVGSNGVHHLVAVTLGVFDDARGVVQVTRTSLVPGDRVVVPRL